MNVSPSLIAGNAKSYNQKLNVFKTVSGLTKIDCWWSTAEARKRKLLWNMCKYLLGKRK